MHPDDMAATTAEIVKLMGGAVTVDFANRYRCKDGTEFPADPTPSPQVDLWGT